MAQLSKEDISRLEKKGIIIGVKVTCAKFKYDKVEIKSWDDFEKNTETYDIISKRCIDRGGEVKLYLFYKNIYATVVTPAPSPINWDRAPEWAQYHTFDESKIGYWFDDKLPFPGICVWKAEGVYQKSSYVKPNDIRWNNSLISRPELTIDDKIIKLEKQLAALRDEKEKETPIKIEEITNRSSNKYIFIGSGKAPHDLWDRCLMFKSDQLEMQTQQHEGYTVLTFHKI